MSERREVAACPNRSFLRDYGRDPFIEQFKECLHNHGPTTAIAEREHVGSQQDHGADFFGGQGVAHSTGVAPNQVDLKLPELIRRDVHIGKHAETRANSVHDRPLCDDALDDSA